MGLVLGCMSDRSCITLVVRRLRRGLRCEYTDPVGGPEPKKNNREIMSRTGDNMVCMLLPNSLPRIARTAYQ
jgi:hypothetical protein